MKNQQGAPTSPELEQKRKIVEKLKAEKAARDKEIEDLENQLKEQKQEVEAALRYLDQLAKEHQDKLNALKASNDPAARPEIERIESKLALYRTVREAAARFEESMGPSNLTNFAATALSLRQADGEVVVANAKIVLKDLAPAMEILKFAVGQPVRMNPAQNRIAMPIKTKVQANQALKQQVTATLHYYQDASASATQEEANLTQLKKLSGKEALQFAANTMKISGLTGKINNLRNLHQTYGKDPILKPLFPEPAEVTIPKLPPSMKTQKAPQKALTGMLKDLLGFQDK